MTVVATVAKFIAAWLTQKSLRFTIDERRLIFGLSNAQAAATLAAVLVGYNVILGHSVYGAPIRLLNESVLNGTIIMILVTCTIASFVAQKGGKNISLSESTVAGDDDADDLERILIPVSNPDSIEELINLSSIIKSKSNKNGLFALNVLNDDSSELDVKAKKILDKAVFTASANDIQLQKILRYDISTANGIVGVVKEQHISDLVLGINVDKVLSDSFLGKLTDGVLMKCNTTTFIYRSLQPISTIKRHVVIVSPNAEKEIGFPFWLSKIWNISKNTGAKIVFYATQQTLTIIKEIHRKHPIESDFKIFDDWDDFLIISRDIRMDDNMLIVLSRSNRLSYHEKMSSIPSYLNKYFQSNSFILVYPMQDFNHSDIDLSNPSMMESFEKLDEIGKNIMKLFKRK